ncbi:hypothetical protein [Priestia endophytica]|uniref:hypothetical protein n=1 Tax=Priestia endophytica TaxID=135735 RepID=UPI00227F6BFD|nr:hypothetical protein [Priestia endophytica]MCY8235160.1 hypothetical protein [Priestia endophytica]
MGRKIRFAQDELILELTGLTSYFCLKRKVRIPYHMIDSVLVDYYEAPQIMLRMPGTSVPGTSIREGSFKYRDEWYFLSYERREPLVMIELTGHKKYRYVIFQMEDPTETAYNIRTRLREWEIERGKNSK